MSTTHVQITINIELLESGTIEVILCPNFLFSPTSQLLAAVKIILIIFRYLQKKRDLSPSAKKDVAPPLVFYSPVGPPYSSQAIILSKHHFSAVRS